MTMIRLALAFLIPLLSGWLIIRCLWPGFPRLLRLSLSWAVGSGITGATYFAALTLSNSKTISLIAGESVLIATAALAITKKRSPEHRQFALPEEPRGLAPKIIGIGFVLTALLAAIAFINIADYSKEGGWDATSIWNLKARFIVRTDSNPIERFSDPYLVAGAHPDYPLLLPSFVASTWQIAGLDSTNISEGIAVMFTFSTFIIAFFSVRLLLGRSHAFLLGCLLLSAPVFLVQGASQYADIVMACFMTATVSLFCLLDSEAPPHYLALAAGLFAGFAASTKNEGLLFLLVVFVARILLLLFRRNYRDGAKEIAQFAIGALPGLIAVVLFKVLRAPPNEIAGQASLSLLASRLQDVARHTTIWKEVFKIRNFASWPLHPMPLMFLYLVVSRLTASRTKSVAVWGMPALVLLGMLSGEYVTYLMTPYDLVWHMDNSLDRLLMQVWPTALVFFCLFSVPRNG